MRKNKVDFRLTESKLNRMILESIKRTLNENSNEDAYYHILNIGESEELYDRLTHNELDVERFINETLVKIGFRMSDLMGEEPEYVIGQIFGETRDGFCLIYDSCSGDFDIYKRA